MVTKKYTKEDARKFMQKLTIILGLSSDNIPADKELFYELLINNILNVYGEDIIFEKIELTAKGLINIDLKFYNKPISIIWFMELCNANNPNRPGWTA